MVRDKSHHYVSPHVQVSFPVTDHTNFRLSYAHQVQAPDFGAILTGINTDNNTSNPNKLYGSDLDFGRTIAFEFGVRHAFSDDMVLDIAAYNSDSDLRRRRADGEPDRSHSNGILGVRLVTNADFGKPAVSMCGSIGDSATTSRARWRTPSNRPKTPATIRSRTSTSARGSSAIGPAAITPPPQAILTTATNRPHTWLSPAA